MIGSIELSTDDVHDLIEVIEYRLAELQDELVHTDDRAYKQSLRLATGRLEGLRERVHHLVAEVPVRRTPSPLARRG